MGVRQERRIARTRELLDAAMELVIADGMAGLTIGSLAERVEAAVGAIYRYFPSKTALIAALQVRAVEELQQAVQGELAWLDALERSDAQQLAAAVAVPWAYYRDLVAHPARRLLINRSLGAPDPLLSEDEAQQVDAALQPLLGLAAERIEAATSAGLLEDGAPRARAMLAWAGVQGLTLFLNRDRLQPAELRSAQLLGAQLATLLRGWGADATLTSHALTLLG